MKGDDMSKNKLSEAQLATLQELDDRLAVDPDSWYPVGMLKAGRNTIFALYRRKLIEPDSVETREQYRRYRITDEGKKQLANARMA